MWKGFFKNCIILKIPSKNVDPQTHVFNIYIVKEHGGKHYLDILIYNEECPEAIEQWPKKIKIYYLQ